MTIDLNIFSTEILGQDYYKTSTPSFTLSTCDVPDHGLLPLKFDPAPFIPNYVISLSWRAPCVPRVQYVANYSFLVAPPLTACALYKEETGTGSNRTFGWGDKYITLSTVRKSEQSQSSKREIFSVSFPLSFFSFLQYSSPGGSDTTAIIPGTFDWRMKSFQT